MQFDYLPGGICFIIIYKDRLSSALTCVSNGRGSKALTVILALLSMIKINVLVISCLLLLAVVIYELRD